MSTANKLSYLNDTKSLLRTSLNKFGSSILSTDTFRSYDTKLNDIYDKLPKITQSGAGFTLENVQNGKVDDFKMLGVDLIQDGEPSPDYPQDIKVVEGRQVINDSGKNLLNIPDGTYSANGVTAVAKKGVITLNGTASNGNSSIKIPFIFNFEDTKTYAFSANNEDTIGSNDRNELYSAIRFDLSNSSSTSTWCLFGTQNNSITINMNYNAVIFCIRTGAGLTYNNFVIKPQLEENSSATDYEPYYNPVSYNIDLNLENIYLAKIPDTNYKNRIYKNNGNWYFEENVKKIVLDGSEDEVWTTFKNSIILNGLWSGKPITMCDSFKETTNELWVSDSDDYRGMCSSLNTAGQFRCMPLNDMTLSDFKTWLSTHNVTLWYPLDNPITTQITNTTLINQLEAISVHTGTNIITISNSNNIIPEIEITRLKELEKLS